MKLVLYLDSRFQYFHTHLASRTNAFYRLNCFAEKCYSLPASKFQLLQLNNYVGECDEKFTTAHNRCEAAIAERDAALAERDMMLADYEPLVAERDRLMTERDSVMLERDNMESDKWDIMKQLREVEDR